MRGEEPLESEVEAIGWEGFRTLPPAAELLGALSPDEYQALKKEIEQYGCLYPILFDENGQILDGVHRYRICKELGLDYPSLVVPGLNDQEKLELALALNLARRHLTPEARKQLAYQLKLRYQWANTLIARLLGVSERTIRRDLLGCEDLPEKVVGKDRKRRPARLVVPRSHQLPSLLQSFADFPEFSQTLQANRLYTPEEFQTQAKRFYLDRIVADRKERAPHTTPPKEVKLWQARWQQVASELPESILDWVVATDPGFPSLTQEEFLHLARLLKTRGGFFLPASHCGAIPPSWKKVLVAELISIPQRALGEIEVASHQFELRVVMMCVASPHSSSPNEERMERLANYYDYRDKRNYLHHLIGKEAVILDLYVGDGYVFHHYLSRLSPQLLMGCQPDRALYLSALGRFSDESNL